MSTKKKHPLQAFKAAAHSPASQPNAFILPNDVAAFRAKEEQEAIHPPHYQGDYVMRIIEDFHLDFLDGQVIKYILRAGRKPGESIIRDLKKAEWYLQRKIANDQNRKG